MLGKGSTYDYVHSFWSDQYEQAIEYVGFAARWDDVVFRGTLESRRFLAFYLQGGALRAAFGLNRGGDPEDSEQDGELKVCAALIRNHVRVDPALLASEEHDLARVPSV